MSTITLNGVSSSTIQGLLIQELPPISKPKIRTQTEEIDGRDGDIVTRLGYSAYDKEIKIGLTYGYDVDDVIAYFDSQGIVIFSNEPDKYYNYQINDQIDFERLIRFKQAEVKFHVQPFKYKVGEEPVTYTPETETVSGSIVTFDGTAGTSIKSLVAQIVPIQDLHGQNAPYPAGGGVNIWDEEWELGGIGSNGNPYNSTTSIRAKNFTEIFPSTVYYARSSRAVAINYYDESKDFISVEYPNNNTFTTPSNARYLRIAFLTSYGTTYKNDTSINYPSTDHEYHPYSNICPISGWDEVEVNATGINAFDEEMELGRFNTATGENTSSTTQLRSKNYIPIKGGTQYYFKTTAGMWCLFFDSNKTAIPSNAPSGYATADNSVLLGTSYFTFTAPQNACYMRFYLLGGYGATYKNDISINYPSTDHEYHAYHGQSHSITLPSTVYGGEGDIISGEWQDTMRAVDMGDLNWTNYKAGGFRAVLDGSINATTSLDDPNLVTSMYRTHPATDTLTDGMTCISIGTIFCVNANFSTDADAFKEAMRGQTAVYRLATPTDFTTTPEQIQTLLGLNNIWADSGEVSVGIVKADLTAVNEGNIFAKPTLYIEGSGTVGVLVNGEEALSIDMSEIPHITIDVPEMNAYYDTELANRKVTGDPDDLFLDIGTDTISFTGNVTKAELTEYSRWI